MGIGIDGKEKGLVTVIFFGPRSKQAGLGSLLYTPSSFLSLFLTICSSILATGNAKRIMYPTENNVHNNPTNGHHPQRSQAQHHKDPVTVVGIPSVSIQNNRLEVGSSQSSQSLSFIARSPLTHPPMQVRHDLTHPSRYWEMVLSERSGCAIGMGPYPPIPLSLPCNVDGARARSGLGSD